ncbi:MAG: hypothetical protein ACYC6H_09110 [Bellilinea sp.]
MMSAIEIGRLLRAGTTGCVIGCRVSQLDTPSFGGLVRIPLQSGYQVYGLIHDIHIDDDGLVRQLVTSENISQDVLLDNRVNRNVPVEISVIFCGFEQDDRISHLLPPRPPLSLDAIYVCSPEEIVRFTGAGQFGYFRHILRADDVPLGELLAAHLEQASRAHAGAGHAAWVRDATQELITLLRDDYPSLVGVLSALRDTTITEF